MDRTITVGRTAFQPISDVAEMMTLRNEDGLVLAKTTDMLRRIERLLDGRRVENIVELGIFRGGSTAYFAERYDPRRIAAIDIRRASPALDDWISEQGRSEQVRTFYETDQGDAERLRAIHAEVFAGEPLDLVEDDASHHLDLTRSSFNTLFPLLRPGGVYIIEDWAWAERGIAELVPAFRSMAPLSGLIHEIVTASVTATGLIDEIQINERFVAVLRGPAAIAEPFDIRDHLGRGAPQA